MIGQQKEIKLAQDRMQQSVSGCLRDMDNSMVDVTRAVVKNEQYNRRDTLTVVGLPKPVDETEDTLSKKIAETLCISGESVAPDDFTAVHRNGKEPRKTPGGKTIPPSVTVKFNNISKKDKVIRNYKNFDHTNKTPRQV